MRSLKSNQNEILKAEMTMIFSSSASLPWRGASSSYGRQGFAPEKAEGTLSEVRGLQDLKLETYKHS